LSAQAGIAGFRSHIVIPGDSGVRPRPFLRRSVVRQLTVAASTGLLFAHGSLRGERRDPTAWERQLRMLSNQGFTAVDLSELWLPMSDLTESEVQRLGSAIAATGMSVAGVSIIGVDLSRRENLQKSRAKVLRALEVSQVLGASLLSVGFHELPVGTSLPGRWTASDEDEHARIGFELKSLAQEGEARGIELSLEMFERGILDRSANVLAIIDAAESESVGANPDLANLLRAPWPLVEEWDTTLRHLAPRVNYWHVKNGMRMTHPDGSVVYQPTDMQRGNIDYRSALLDAVRNGFRGPLAIEHYGGDAVAQAASGRAYLERVIEDVCTYEGIDLKEIK